MARRSLCFLFAPQNKHIASRRSLDSQGSLGMTNKKIRVTPTKRFG